MLELARDALQRLVPVEATSSEPVNAALEAIEQARARRELVVVIAGRDRAARTALLNAIAGAALLAEREPGGPIVSIGRGERDAGVAHGDGDRFPCESLRAPEPRPPWWAVWRWAGRWLRQRRPAAPIDLATWIDRAVRRQSTTAIDLRLAGARLPDGVVVVDAGDAHRPAIEIDGCLMVGGGEPAGFAGIDSVELSGLFSVDGDRPIAELQSALDRLSWQRAARLARPALAAITAAGAVFDDMIERSESELAERAAAIDGLRFDDPDGFAERALEAVRSPVIQLVHQLIEQLSSQLSAELEQLGRRWKSEIESSELRGITSRLASEGPARLAEVRGDLLRLLQAALRGSAHQLFTRAIDSLPHREAGTSPAPPEPSTVEIVPALAPDSVALLPPPSRLGDLFRSADTRKERMVESLTERLAKLRKLALSELLDSEPALESALLEPLRQALVEAARAHARDLADRRAAERLAIASERARLEPIVNRRDRAAADAARLGRALEG